MIRIDLLQTRFETHVHDPEIHGSSPVPEPIDIGGAPRRKSNPFVFILLVLILLGGAAGGWWWWSNRQDSADLVPPVSTVIPNGPYIPDLDTGNHEPTVPAPTETITAPPAADHSHAPQPPAPAVTEASVPAPVSEPSPPAPSQTPAPPAPTRLVSGPTADLPAGILDRAIDSSARIDVTPAAPARFEDLSPSQRGAWQVFAAWRLLSIVRQVAPVRDLGFIALRFGSPSWISIEGTMKEPAIFEQLVQGVIGQGLTDTASTVREGRFGLRARMPFSPDFGPVLALLPDPRMTLNRVGDLARQTGLRLGEPRAAGRGHGRRSAWTVEGTGSYASVVDWLGALRSGGVPMGLRDLEVRAAKEGVRVRATLLVYAP